MKKYLNTFRFSFLPHYTGVSFRISKSSEMSNIQKVMKEFFQKMQPYAYGINDDTLEHVLGEKLRD